MKDIKKEKIVLTSGSWPQGVQIPIVSNIHSRILSLDMQIQAKDLVFRKIIRSDLPDFKGLEKEWFPFYAGDSFYDQIELPKICAVGCFWNPPTYRKCEIMLGAIMVSFEDISKSIKYIKRYYKANNKLIRLSKIINFCNNINCVLGHILTIGVIDEARRLGIASELMNQIQFYAKILGKNLIGISLHVCEFNIAAIKCYEKNGYKHVLTEVDYYTIFNKKYDGLYYIKPLFYDPKNTKNTIIKCENIFKNENYIFELISQNIADFIIKDIKTTKKYTAKMYYKIEKPSFVEREIQLLEKIEENKGLAKFANCFSEQNLVKTHTKSVFIIYEYLEGYMNLYDFMKLNQKLSESSIIVIMNQIISAIEFLHSKSIICKNLSPLNILIKPDSSPSRLKVKIMNFAISDFYFEQNFCSPESIKFKVFNENTDIWSIGCIFYLLVTQNVFFIFEYMK